MPLKRGCSRAAVRRVQPAASRPRRRPISRLSGCNKRQQFGRFIRRVSMRSPVLGPILLPSDDSKDEGSDTCP
jgi:hypothetical protein